MTDEDALLQTICASPADNTARLVFADYLQEHGGPVGSAWAFLIRAQIEMAEQPDAVAEATASRLRTLDAPFWHAKWLARLGLAKSKLTWSEWARGFPAQVSGRHHELRDEWALAFSRVPVEKLWITGCEDQHVEELVARPELRRVRKLSINTKHNWINMGDRTFLALAACEFLRDLRELTVYANEFTDRGAEALLDSPHLGSLTAFRVHSWSQRHQTPLSRAVRERLERRFSTLDVC
jgi:uncharacterized protein (TIGR02996 family)